MEIRGVDTSRYNMVPMYKAVLIALIATFVPAFASAQVMNPALDWEQRLLAAHPLPLQDVRLTGGPLKHAQDLELEYLLALEPNRMLAFLRRSAKLEPKAQGYGGWDGDGRQLTGHIAGHYLSGVSLAWAATGDARFKDRANYIVNEMKAHSGRAGRRLYRRADGPQSRRRKDSLPAAQPGHHPLRRLRPERHVVAVVRAAQDFRRPARRLSLHRKPHGPRSRDQVRGLGGSHSRAAQR